MCNRLLTALFVLCLFSLNVSAKNSDDPFAKNKIIDVGKDVHWDIDEADVLAIKTVRDDSGVYYHLIFDNKQLELLVSSDADGLTPKSFNNLEIKAFMIDGKPSPLFAWCLNNQQRHNRFLQQGLSVKKNICELKGESGQFILHLNRDTLAALKNGQRLTVIIKPFRTPVELSYDIGDFEEMTLALNAKSKPVAKSATAAAGVATVSSQTAATSGAKKCWAKPPEKYKTLDAVEYDCSDATAKLDAESTVTNQVDQIKASERELAAQRSAELEKQRKLAEDKKRQEEAARLKHEEQLKIDAAVAASAMKQAEIGDDIANKMVAMCDKYWQKGEHRCYCQKYIEHAPDEIQKSSTCE